jgi:hypothetical protein
MKYSKYKSKDLGILIVNLNNIQLTKDIINDLNNQINKNFKIHLFDQNSSEEGTSEYLDSLERMKKIIVIKNSENIPLNHLWNNFVNDTNYEYICFLNNDVRVTNNFTYDIIKTLDERDDVGIIIHPTNNDKINKTTEYNLKILDNPPLYQGWDFSFRREVYMPIPQEMLIFGGDDLIFSYVLKKNYKIGLTISSPIIHFKERTRVKICNIKEIQANDARLFISEISKNKLQLVQSTMNGVISNRYPSPTMKLIENKKCIYTALIGDYDKLYSVDNDKIVKQKDWDYICFTDNSDIKSDFWKIIYIGNDTKEPLDNYRLSRYLKTNFDKYLSSYDYLIWKDCRCIINCNLNTYLDNLKDSDILFSEHSNRKNILQECDALISGNLETTKMINKIKNRYEANGYKYDNGLYASRILCFRNNKKIVDFFNDWWYEINNYSHRDQLSLNYVLSNHNLKIKTLSFKIVFSNNFKLGHRKSTRLSL